MNRIDRLFGTLIMLQSKKRVREHSGVLQFYAHDRVLDTRFKPRTVAVQDKGTVTVVAR